MGSKGSSAEWSARQNGGNTLLCKWLNGKVLVELLWFYFCNNANAQRLAMQSAQSHINGIFIRCELITNKSSVSSSSYIINVSSCQPFTPHSTRNLICSELASCCHFELMCCILPEIRICNSIHFLCVYLALKISIFLPLSFPQTFVLSLPLRPLSHKTHCPASNQPNPFA